MSIDRQLIKWNWSHSLGVTLLLAAVAISCGRPTEEEWPTKRKEKASTPPVQLPPPTATVEVAPPPIIPLTLEQELCLAIEVSNPSKVRELLRSRPILLQATRCLLEKESPFDGVPTYSGPLYFAVRWTRPEIVRILLSEGASPIEEPYVESAPGKFELIRKRFADRSIDYDLHPLSVAARRNDVASATYLLEKQPRLSRVNLDGFDALSVAIRAGSLEMIDCLSAHGARFTQNRAITAAGENGQLNVFQRMLENGAQPNDTDSKSGLTLLQTAVALNDIEIVRTLLRAGAEVNSPIPPFPFEMAIENRNLELARLLFSYRPKRMQKHLLSLAARNASYFKESKDLELLEFLLCEVGEPVDGDDCSPEDEVIIGTPFQESLGYLRAARLLLQYGADINRADCAGDTALHRAIRRESINEIGFLLSHGAEHRARNNRGLLPSELEIRDGKIRGLLSGKKSWSQFTSVPVPKVEANRTE